MTERSVVSVGSGAMRAGDAAEALGVSASTLRRWADRGRLRVARTSGGHRRFAVEDVQRLRRESAGRAVPVLRPARLPATPMPDLASLIHDEGAELVERAVSLLYEPGHAGWHAGTAGVGCLEVWFEAVRAAAAGEVAWDAAIGATRALADGARHGGAAQVEGHLLLERIQDLMQFRLRERGASHAVLVEGARLLRALDRAILDTGSYVS